MLQNSIDHTGAVEPGDHSHTPGHGGGLEPADFLHPPHVPLNLCALDGQRREVLVGASPEEQAQVGFGVGPGGAGVATQESRGCQSQDDILVISRGGQCL